jgi:hypothetical protein
MDVFDGPPMNQSCAARAQTTGAPQALALFNGEFTRDAASHVAARLRREAGDDAVKQIDHGFRLAFTRPPGQAELETALKFLREQAIIRNGDAATVLADFCHVLLNANELIHPD